MNKHFLKEHVMVFERDILKEVGVFQGLSFDVTGFIDAVVSRQRYSFRPREIVETDSNYKQVIVYALLKFDDKIFTYRRGKLLSEERLRGNYSLGVGGHISSKDPEMFGTPYDEALRREIHEEVTLEDCYKLRLSALLNDDSDAVGQVHFGLIYVVDLDSPCVTPKEKSINDVKFMNIRDLFENIHKFENWSQICIRSIDRLVSQQ